MAACVVQAGARPVVAAQLGASRLGRHAFGPATRSAACAPLQASAQRRRQAAGTRARAAALRVCALRNIDWPEALLFDCDGVLVDTEAEGHRVAFNEAFKRKGLAHEWSFEQYGVLLETGGGKERMDRYFSSCADAAPWADVTDPAQRKAFLKELHELKTDIFNQLIETGALPVRPGVKRLINEAIDNGVKVAVCSTSNERAVSNIVKVLLGDRIASHMPVYAGDCVPKKKPAPDIYDLAAKELDVNPARCVVIEDSRIGLAAAKAAGMRCVVTESYYTKGEDFTIADAVFDCIGEAGDERFGLNDLTTPGLLALSG
ncbi:haloacid dehalogenase-like hydrolase domain-containing protein isoform A [Micractinium conductrix]|uniref:Haloacid dehalogenase-like hydrolase domain-containing protein isoform A n=1 Tax=Micractinium conductrix TaxID=554055 RepID=A0A2P6VLZ2_9CHLO|nr:haloacid dehalogenase-like hydrolase domain-containing protein isoform A [Micractinium conductrix]|eukprot:PSC75122.1 haloacid dehalogenase-like hydrolase domain-containing protein isoform A [Micractinium conductrix]